MEDNFRHIALFGEPALFFYGDEKNPSMILAFGSTVNRKLSLCTIDDTELRELIAAVSDKADQSAADIEKLGARIISTINAAGLVLDENKIANQVSYEPGNSDALIKNAASIAEAVGIISQFVQKHVEDTELTVEDSKSVKIIYNKVEGEGATLKAKVLISGDGDTDEEDFNNNIIGVKKDGIFASANIEYDEDRHRLIFTTSGFDKNGKFKDDANKKVIDFGEHTEYTANNEDHDVKVTIDQDTHKISADVKISTDEDNGLVVKDGRLYVSMRAKDIKYKSSTVAKALNDLNDEIASIKEKIVILEGNSFIKGEETDTMVTTATHERNGGYTVKGDVRLSGNSSIIVKEGGLAVNIDVAVDKTTNKLTLTVGNETKVVELPGIDIISDMYYDGSNKALVIKTSDGKTITIPVGDMLTTWIVNNPANSPVVLTKATGASGTPDELSADLKLASSDNILKVDASGNLTAPKSEITNAVSVETDRATAAEQALSARIDEANDNIGENRTAIANEKAARELSESEIKADIETEVARAKAAEQALDAKIVVVEDNFVELKDTVNEKIVVVDGIDTRLTQAEDAIVANTTAIETESGRAREAEADIKVDVTANAQNIETEKTRAQGVETQLASGIANTNTAITEEVTRAQGAEENLKTRMSEAERKLIVIQGGENTEGSITAIAKHYADDVKAALDNEVTRAKEAEDAIRETVADNKAEATQAAADALADAKHYTDDQITNLSTTVNAKFVSEKAEITEAYKAYADNGDTTVKSETKAYTDEKVEAEKARAIAAETANTEAITAIQTKDGEQDTEIAKKIEKVEIVKNGDLQYFLVVDGVNVSEIDIPKDQFLKSVTYDSSNKKLHFVFVTSDGEVATDIDISDLIDTYTAGNGLTLANGEFAVRVNEDTEPYLFVSEEGITIRGIDAALALKADKVDLADYYTKTEADAKFLTEHQDISGLATKDEVAAVDAKADAIEARVAANEGKLDVLNGNESTAGSVKKALADAKAYTDEKVSAEAATARAAEQANADAIAVINGNEAQEGSIKKAVKDAEAYADAAVAAEKTAREQSEADIMDAVDTKANAADVYTKAEIDAKNFLVGSDIANLATKAELAEETTRATTAETKNADDIAALAAVVDTKVGQVSIAKSPDNDLVYILKVDGEEAGRVNVPKDQFLKDVTYNSTTKVLKFTFVTTDDESKEVTVSIADLVDTYTAGNGLALANNQFSVTVDPSTQSYIEVTEYGVKVKGIDEALAAKANAADVYTKEAADAKFLTEHQSLADYALKGEVQTVSEGLAAVKTTADTAAADIAVINGNEAEAGSILNAIKQSKEYTDNAVATEKTARETADAAHTAAIAEKANADDVYTKAEIDAAGFADATEVASTYATKSEVATLETGVNTELAKKVENVALEQGDTNLIYKLMVDGVVKGTINIPKDQFLKDASYDAGNKNLVFVFQTEGEDKTVNVNVADLVDTYTAGNGLKVENNQFSVVINEDSETYLQLTPEGLKVVGIDAALAAKANAADVYTKDEVDAKIPSVTGFATQEWVNEQGFIKEHQDISGLVTKTEVAAVEAKADTNTEAIATLNGNALVEGSVDYKVKNAQDALDAKIANVYTKAESDAKFLTEHQDISGKADAADVAANTAAIAIINGNEAQEGSVKKALADAKVYTDVQVAGKADSASVYTKSEIDNMGFLTQHQDISGKADKTALDAEVLRAQNAEDAIASDMTALTGRVTTAEGDIDTLETDVAANKVIVSETESVKLTSSREATGTTVSADVKLSNTNGNIIKIDGNGLYADASLAYSKTTNTLTFTAGGNSQSFELSEHTLVNNGYYDSETREIVLSLTTAEGAKEVRIKVNDLIHTLSVNNGVNNPLVLAVQHTDEGDVLSASLNISTESHNLILTDNGTLYASNQAKDHTGLWNGVEMPLQQIIENLRAETDKVDDLDGDVADLKTDMQQSKLDILTTQNSVETLSGRVDDNSTAISENTGSINTLATQMNSLAARVETAMTEFDEVSRKVDSYETRVTTLEAAVTGLNADIATLRSQLDAYKATTDARLEAIEEIVNNLIDFGEEG